MSRSTEPVAVRNLNCPICGQANACVAAKTGTFSEPCWCASVTISARVIEQVPTEHQGKSCVCRRCVERLDS